MALQSSQRLPELHSTRRNPTGFFSSNSTRVPIRTVQFYMQKTESSSSTTTIPGIPATRPSKGIPDIHDIPAYPGNSTSSSISRESTPFQHSPIRMHILQTIPVRLVSTETPPSTSWTIDTNYKHYILQRKGDVVISVKLTYSPE